MELYNVKKQPVKRSTIVQEAETLNPIQKKIKPG
jgi:hypothetical protein